MQRMCLQAHQDGTQQAHEYLLWLSLGFSTIVLHLIALPLLYYQSNNCRTVTRELQYCLWRNKQNSFHNAITTDNLIKNFSNKMYFQTTVAEIWSALITLFDLLKITICIPCPINNNFEFEASLLQQTPAAIYWPLAIQWLPFHPVTIYQPLGWSNWPLRVNVNTVRTTDIYHTL